MPPVDYLVCATERSGSTLLCEGLAASGVAGRPQEYFEALRATGLPRQPREYFEECSDPSLGGRLPPVETGPAAGEAGEVLLARAREEGTSPNGVFGAKIMWGHLDDFLARFGPLAPPRHPARRRRLEELFPGVRFVRVVRRDKVRQAISLWKAIQTAGWRAEEEADRRPVYDRAALDHLIRRQFQHEREWTRFFEEGRVEPLEISYERFSEAYEETLRSVLAWLGIPEAAEVPIGPPPLRRQADETSEAWHARYLEDAKRPGSAPAAAEAGA